MKQELTPMGCFNAFSGPFTEWYLLANIATLFPDKTLEFDPRDLPDRQQRTGRPDDPLALPRRLEALKAVH